MSKKEVTITLPLAQWEGMQRQLADLQKAVADNGTITVVDYCDIFNSRGPTVSYYGENVVVAKLTEINNTLHAKLGNAISKSYVLQYELSRLKDRPFFARLFNRDGEEGEQRAV